MRVAVLAGRKHSGYARAAARPRSHLALLEDLEAEAAESVEGGTEREGHGTAAEDNCAPSHQFTNSSYARLSPVVALAVST